MTTSFHSPLTGHRENTRLPLPPSTSQPLACYPAVAAWHVGVPCWPAQVTLTRSRRVCKGEGLLHVDACPLVLRGGGGREFQGCFCLKRHFANCISQVTDSETWEVYYKKTS